MKIEDGSLVTIHFELFDKQKELVESTLEGDPVTFRCGDGDALPGLERALVGAQTGDELRLTIDCDDAFGAYQPEGLLNVPRAEFPADLELELGEWIAISVQPEENEQGEEEEELEARIIEVGDEEVVLDANHPLAGQEVTFKVRVVSVDAPGTGR